MRSTFARIAIAAVVCIGAATQVFAQADLSLTFSGGPTGTGCPGTATCGGGSIPITPGGQAAFGAIVKNDGPSSANTIVLTVTFPSKTSIAQFTPTVGWSCMTSTVGMNPTLTCTQGTMLNASFSAVTIVLNLAVDYPWQNGLPATAALTSATPDPNTADNNRMVTLPVTAPIPALTNIGLFALALCLGVVGFIMKSI